MNNPRFIDQYSKIVGAYLRDELRPMDNCACFVGNLLNGDDRWGSVRNRRKSLYDKIAIASCLSDQTNNFYTAPEIKKLEATFMGWGMDDYIKFGLPMTMEKLFPDYEDRLYRAMERALLYLRQLHESKGEVIEGYEFRKRELVSK